LSSEAKVGIFFVVAILLVGTIAVYLGDFWTRYSSYPVLVFFRDAQGLPGGAEARLSGVRIGTVSSVRLVDDPQHIGRPAAVEMRIRRGYRIYRSDTFLIQQGALLGDKYVEVRRTEATPRQALEAGSKVDGQESASLESLTDEARQLVREATVAVRTVQATVVSSLNQRAIQTILTNVVGATGKADAVAAQALQLAIYLRQSAAQTGPEVAAMAKNLAATAASVQRTARLIEATLATSPLPGELAQAGANVRQATGDLAAMSQNMAAVFADPGTRNKLDGMLTNLHQASEDLRQTLARVEKLASDTQMEGDVRATVSKLRESAESLSRLTAHAEKVMTDPELTADIQATVKSARTAAENGAAAAAKADASLDRVDRTMDRLSQTTKAFRPEDARSRATLTGSTGSGLRLDWELDLQYGQRHHDFWRLGVYDIGDAERLNLQRSVPLGRDARVRVGVFANKLGVGYDFWQDRRLGFETELWDPNDLRFDVRGTYGISPRADLLFGLESIGQGTDPFLGLRYRSER
jgi:ABC-type transporter Mla subunit MlaD